MKSNRTLNWLAYNDINNINFCEFVRKIIHALCPYLEYEDKKYLTQGNSLYLYKDGNNEIFYIVYVDFKRVQLRISMFKNKKK